MITHLRGTLDSKSQGSVVIDAGGVGYEVQTAVSAYDKLPGIGAEIKLYIVESVPMYGGGVSLYGFLTDEERGIFLLLKEVPGTGAKKAMDYLDKISKSPADFKRFVGNKDAAGISGIFGFTKKTSDKLVAALKDKIGAFAVSGQEKWKAASESTPSADAISGLVSLGYRESHAREAVEKALNAADKLNKVADIIKAALRHL